MITLFALGVLVQLLGNIFMTPVLVLLDLLNYAQVILAFIFG